MQLSHSPPESLITLNALFYNAKDSKKIQIELNIIAEKCQPILALTNIFQSRTPTTLQAYDYLEDLNIDVDNNSALVQDMLKGYITAVVPAFSD